MNVPRGIAIQRCISFEKGAMYRATVIIEARMGTAAELAINAVKYVLSPIEVKAALEWRFLSWVVC